MLRTFKKLVSALTTFGLIVETSQKFLERASYIQYLIWFKKNEILALLDLGSKVNAITLVFVSKPGLKVRYTNVGGQKIDGSILKTFKIALTSFYIVNKLGRARFFQRILLLANISIKMVSDMLFFNFSNANI